LAKPGLSLIYKDLGDAISGSQFNDAIGVCETLTGFTRQGFTYRGLSRAWWTDKDY
jgi:hypothetical protein